MAIEYKIENVPQSFDQIQPWLNELGKVEWELVFYAPGSMAVFKRKLTGPTEAK